MLPASASQKRRNLFLGLSELLTGFDQVALIGAGVADEHLGTLDRIVSPTVVDEVLAAYASLPQGPGQDSAAQATILADPKIGPVSRSLIVLWYSGAWTQMPDSWRAAYGASKDDTSRVVSGAAYVAGLQWAVVGAHPAGARAQGFGAWALAPMSV